MIELTVKTLDSQNHSFTVEDEITVAQFKEKIAETINIPSDTQRIIYCGRVLKDEIKLKDYDVHGKVVHLVQRAPPSTNPNANRSASPQPQRRGRGLDQGNAMYLGSMAFPSNIMDSQSILPPPPTHSLAGSRLNVAKRMLRRAEAVLNILENPQTRTTDQTPPEEAQEEVTPVFEARVIVPSHHLNEPIDEALVLSAVQNTLLNADSVPGVANERTENSAVAEPEATTSTAESDTPQAHSASSTPEDVSPTSTSTENLINDQREEGANGRIVLSENASPTSEMADLLATLGRLQVRFAPFLEQYQNFMRQDPVVPQEDVRKMQGTLNRVSEILHLFGHAYHSLSDIIVRARTPPPRALLCRPILIQHSAVLQTGFPIQVEAQLNFSPEMATTPATSQSTTTTNTLSNNPVTTTSNPETTTSATSGSGSGSASSSNSAPTITAHISPQMIGFPLLSAPAGVHVQSFPIEIRGIRQNSSGNPNVGNSAGATARIPSTNANTNESVAPNVAANNATTESSATNGTSNFNNPNVEFFMEVTPDSITIDSLETTLLASNQTGDLLRGPSPEFLQSIMQMAGQIMSRTGQNITTTSGATPTVPPPDGSSQSTQANVSSTQSTGQNSQARGNTQTNPTTATQTRSTARPHVHLAQHAMQGFDPFLPCNSHHVRRRISTRNIPQQQGNPNNNSRPQQNAAANVANQFNPIYNIVNGILSSFQNVYNRQRGNQQHPQTSTPPNVSVPDSAAAGAGGEYVIPPPPLSQLPFFLPHIQNMNLSDVNSQGPTIAQLLQQLPDETYVDGESIFTDLIMLLSRNLTIGDIINLNNGRLEPLMRIRNDLRNFFFFRVLDGLPNMANTDRGVNRLITEMQPFLENLDELPVRDDIDIVRSTQMLFTARLPNIISLAASRSPNSLRMLVEQCRITARQFFALILHASANGQAGVEEVLNHIVSRYMQGIPPDIQQWTLVASRAHLRQFISNLSVPQSILQPYIVRKVDSVTSPVLEVPQTEACVRNETEEPMELDEQEASGSSNEVETPVLNLHDDTEPLPAVIIGSEPWHSQVPADWVPIITRDTQRQRRQNQQQSFSDAYLSGMPSKRRKIVTSAKPQGSLPQVISESVRRAVTATGLTSVTPLETVAQAAGSDINIQSAYRDLLRTSVQTNLEGNEDFTPDRFPNATNYFNKPQ